MIPIVSPPAKWKTKKKTFSRGPSLPLLYSLIALALAAAIGCALLIVLPFYRRAH